MAHRLLTGEPEDDPVMNFRSCFSACALVTTALVGAGCSSSNQAPTSEQYDDVAQSLSAVVSAQGGGGELGSFSATASLATGTTPAGVTANAQGTFESSSAGVSYQFSLACDDVQGHALAQCGPTTNSAQANVTWSGDLSLPNLTATVQRSGSLALNGFPSGVLTIQGDGSFQFDAQFESLFRNAQASAHLTFTSSYQGITYDEAAKHVTGGTAHYTVNATASSSSTNGSTSSAYAIDAQMFRGRRQRDDHARRQREVLARRGRVAREN